MLVAVFGVHIRNGFFGQNGGYEYNLVLGDADTVAQKVLYVNEALGGLSRIAFGTGVSAPPQEKMLRSIELLGTRVRSRGPSRAQTRTRIASSNRTISLESQYCSSI